MQIQYLTEIVDCLQSFLVEDILTSEIKIQNESNHILLLMQRPCCMLIVCLLAKIKGLLVDDKLNVVKCS